jgi:DTW domain-containing protein YfiP
MRTNIPGDHSIHCFRCCLRQEICICSILPTVQTRAEFLILRHIREARSTSNTGWLVALAMPNSRIISCGGGTRIGLSSLDEESLGAPVTYLLWADGMSTLEAVAAAVAKLEGAEAAKPLVMLYYEVVRRALTLRHGATTARLERE